jgi:hypothetical protein
MEGREQMPPKRIEVLTAVRLPALGGTIHELRVVLDLLERAIRYVESGQWKPAGIGTAAPARRNEDAHD